MSTVKANNLQVGQSVTATNNFTVYQPSSPDGTVRWGVGNSGSVTDIVTLNSSGYVGVGTTVPGYNANPARSYLSIKGPSGSGVVQLVTSTGVTGENLGNLEWIDTTNTSSSSGRVGYVALFSYGSTANNRGSFMSFATKPDGVSSGGVEVMRLDSSGNLGLGVTPSAWASSFKAYQVGAAAAVTGYLNRAYVSANWYYDGTANKYIVSDYATRYGQLDGQHQWFTAPSGTAGNAITFTQAMTLDASGNLGIGTSSVTSGAKLQVTGSDDTYVFVKSDGAGDYSLSLGSGGTPLIARGAGAPLAFGTVTNNSVITSWTEQMRIDSSGNVGIGTSSPAAQLHVQNGGGNSESILAQYGSGTRALIGAYANLVAFKAYNGTNDVMAFYTGASERMRIDSGGNLLVGTTSTTKSGFSGAQLFTNVSGSGTAINASRNDTASIASSGLIAAYSNYSTTEEKFIVRANGDVQNRTGSYTAYSDERLKENITDARSYLNDLTKLRVVNYNFKDGAIKTKYLGFIAQEVEKVMPGLVFETESDGLQDCKGVKLTVLIPMLVQAIQELTARIEQLEAK